MNYDPNEALRHGSLQGFEDDAIVDAAELAVLEKRLKRSRPGAKSWAWWWLITAGAVGIAFVVGVLVGRFFFK